MSRTPNWRGNSGKETAARVRNLPIQDLSFGRWLFHIDEQDMQALVERFPELNPNNGELDPETRRKAWNKWAQSSASEPYRVQSKARL